LVVITRPVSRSAIFWSASVVAHWWINAAILFDHSITVDDTSGSHEFVSSWSKS
jgi:hypothetical protein